jgi:hypothetical protein
MEQMNLHRSEVNRLGSELELIAVLFEGNPNKLASGTHTGFVE